MENALAIKSDLKDEIETITNSLKDSIVELHLCGTMGVLPTDYEYEIEHQ